ncbi:MAG: tRNA 2-thiouridine(34) synthase MnmA [Actinobacteria bacterium]|nr:tRNA 2-thiouridine(34) synthase MnmA [Actinomycetota bacterium]
MDSAVAALRLIEEGRTLETATVRLWPGGDRRSCCSPGALQRARQTAEWLGLPHHFIEREAEFEAQVVAPFVAAYLGGETPNPCVSCNPGRLAALVGLADELGLARVATGHYARLVWRDGAPYLARGADPAKDQSYMLWAVPPEVLARLEFPLGEMTKPETRAVAEAAGLPVAGEPASQEVCFAVDGYQRFLDERGVRPRAGAIVDSSGAVLGTHQGHWRYTIGQRRGLGVSSTEPLFVLARRAAANEVMVGRRAELEVREVAVRALVDRGLGDGGGLRLQLRYRSPATPVAALERRGATQALVRLGEAFTGAAPGQAAVFYREDVVVGGGVLAEPA